MYRAKQVQDWDHTAALMATIANIMRDKKKQPLTPEQLNPFREQPTQRRLPFGHLKEVLENGNRRGNQSR